MNTLDKEREKYRRMYAHPSYRIGSPGERDIYRMFELVRPGDSFGDMGCGLGRAGAKMAELGADVTLVDFAPNAPDFPHLRFVEANLWDLPTDMKFDWIYCVDVLEHIPPEYVERVLDNLARVARKGGYIQIATFEDNCGAVIGETLHLTIHKSDWWRPLIEARWPVVYQDDSDFLYARFMVGAPHVR